jgi:hypothetical protein
MDRQTGYENTVFFEVVNGDSHASWVRQGCSLGLWQFCVCRVTTILIQLMSCRYSKGISWWKDGCDKHKNKGDIMIRWVVKFMWEIK